MIIRTQPNLLHRAFDVVVTLIAWYIFLWLLVGGVGRLMAQDVSVTLASLPPQLLMTAQNLLAYSAMALAITAILLLWAKYNQVRAARYQRRAYIPDIDHDTLSASFGVHPSVLTALQHESRMVFHNDEDGHLVQAYLPRLDETVNTAQLRLPTVAPAPRNDN